MFEGRKYFISPYRCWVNAGRWLVGSYETPYGTFRAKIRMEIIRTGAFYIQSPPATMSAHSLWRCFETDGSSWYRVKLNPAPNSIEDGICLIERILTESFVIASTKEGANMIHVANLPIDKRLMISSHVHTPQPEEKALTVFKREEQQ